jgi:lipoprotein Spr
VDCSGLTGKIYQQRYNITLPRQSEAIFQQCTPIDTTQLKPGDLVFFKIEGNSISHVGVYIGNGHFVHASTQAGVVISDLSQPYYQEHFFKAGRIAND